MNFSNAPKSYKAMEKALKKAGFSKTTGGNHGCYYSHEGIGLKIAYQNHGKDLAPAIIKSCIKGINAAAEWDAQQG